MTKYKSEYFQILGHEIHAVLWGNPTNPPMMMWHGLTRTCRDFDELAESLSDRFYVICPDVIGRGLSGWSANPLEEYTVEYYCRLALELISVMEFRKIFWFGTSMGGIIGMAIAAGENSAVLDKLIINDVGPVIPDEALRRILTYTGQPPKFKSVTEAESILRNIYKPFGPAPDSFWRRMTETSLRRCGDGSFTTQYDPNIVKPFNNIKNGEENWELYEKIRIPTHIIWGVDSDILTKPILQRMLETGPKPSLTKFEDCGHAPCIATPESIAKIRHDLNI